MTDGKYRIPKDEDEVVPNKFGLTKTRDIDQAELEGFLYAYKILFDELDENTVFDLKYITRLQQLALEHLYSFAGNWRTVNISKGWFTFPTAKFLPETLSEFEKTVLKKLRQHYDSKDDLVKDI